MKPQSPDIYITGAHRSGTSWVGQMIAAADNYLVRDEEFFNFASEIGNIPFAYSYPYICEQNEQQFLSYVDSLKACHYSLLGGLTRAHSFKDILRVGKRKLRSIGRQIHRPKKTIFVEPTGLMSAEWFAKRYQTPVIVLVRHPAAFVSSLKKLDWGFNFTHLTQQKLLMERFFSEYATEMEQAPKRPDIVGMSILLWKLLYHVVDVYRKDHPDWIVLRHEDLSADPIGQYAALYGKLGLEFTPECRKIVYLHSSGEGGGEFDGKKDKSIRNSAEVIKIWKKRLTPDEIKRIRDNTEPVASRFYDNRSWE